MYPPADEGDRAIAGQCHVDRGAVGSADAVDDRRHRTGVACSVAPGVGGRAAVRREQGEAVAVHQAKGRVVRDAAAAGPWLGSHLDLQGQPSMQSHPVGVRVDVGHAAATNTGYTLRQIVDAARSPVRSGSYRVE